MWGFLGFCQEAYSFPSLLPQSLEGEILGKEGKRKEVWGRKGGLNPLPLPAANASKSLLIQGKEEGLRSLSFPVNSTTNLLPLPIGGYTNLYWDYHVHVIGSHVTSCQQFFNDESKET